MDALTTAKPTGGQEVRPEPHNSDIATVGHGKDHEIAQFRAYRQKEIRELASETFTIFRANACFVSDHEV